MSGWTAGSPKAAWRNGRYLRRFFAIDAIPYAGGTAVWKIMARASAPCQISDQHRVVQTTRPYATVNASKSDPTTKDR